MSSRTVVLGREIGVDEGWDQLDTFVFIFHDFTPVTDVALPAGDLVVDFDNGVFEYFDNDGNVTSSFDVVDTLSKAPRSTVQTRDGCKTRNSDG